jgi:hypothetical protein
MELCYYEYARYGWCTSWDNWKEKKQFIRNSATLKSYWFELLGMVVEN